MDFTNPHFAPCGTHAEPAQTPCTTSADTPPATLPRLRKVTNSPAREFASRPGNVEPLPDSVTALILSFKGRAKVQRNGIKIHRKEISEEPIFFWHEDSLTCLGKQGETVLYVLNPQTPDCIHIMDTAGRYIETVPRKGRPAILDHDAAAKEIAAHRRYMTNQQTRLQQLHGEDTAQILQRHRDNSEEMTRATNIHPAQDTTPEPASAPTADLIRRHGQQHQTHINRRAEQDASASRLGHTALTETPATTRRTPATPDPAPDAEDWSTPAPPARNTTPPVEIEEW